VNEPQTHKVRGLLLSLVAIPIAMVLWVIIWNMGFIASIVAFALAYGVLWLYEKGAGAKPDKTVALPLVAIIVVGSMLSFFAGMVSDGWSYYQSEDYRKDLQVSTNPSAGDTIRYVTEDLGNSEIWNSYNGDMVMAGVFTLLGAGVVVVGLFRNQNTPDEPAENRDTRTL